MKIIQIVCLAAACACISGQMPRKEEAPLQAVVAQPQVTATQKIDPPQPKSAAKKSMEAVTNTAVVKRKSAAKKSMES